MRKDKWVKSTPAPNTFSQIFFITLGRNSKVSQEKDRVYLKEAIIKLTSSSLAVTIEECIKVVRVGYLLNLKFHVHLNT